MKILVTEEQVQQGIRRMAEQIRQHYAGRPLTLVGVMIGSIPLLVDMIRLLDVPMRVELLQARGRRPGNHGPGPLVIDQDLLSGNVRGRDVLLIDDIFDTGRTLWDLIPQIDELGPSSVRSAVLLRKQGRCLVPKQPDFVGFDIPNAFVVGYGLDYEDRFRNLHYIAELEPTEMRRGVEPVSPLRLVLVTRRFWPLVGGAERVMATLAAEWASRSIDVTVLTARWQCEWPAEITYRGVPVVRLPNPQRWVWGTLRYMQSLGRWLRGNCHRYDLAYVSMLKHDAYAALTAVGGRMPVILRAEGAGPTGDCRWQQEANCGARIRRRCLTASGIVVPSRAIRQELIHAGYPEAKVHYLPNGIPIPPARAPGDKLAARNALASIGPALRTAPAAPLAVFTGRLHEAKGLADLVAAWELIAADRPDAQLWLVGEGPYRADLAAQIESRNLAGRVVLAGVFDNVDELLAAADLFVLPSWEEGMSLALLEAMAAGLPVVATDIPGNRDLVTHGQTGLLVPVRDPARLAEAIRCLLDEPQRAAGLGADARELAASRFSLAHMADAHLELFESLIRTA